MGLEVTNFKVRSGGGGRIRVSGSTGSTGNLEIAYRNREAWEADVERARTECAQGENPEHYAWWTAVQQSLGPA